MLVLRVINIGNSRGECCLSLCPSIGESIKKHLTPSRTLFSRLFLFPSLCVQTRGGGGGRPFARPRHTQWPNCRGWRRRLGGGGAKCWREELGRMNLINGGCLKEYLIVIRQLFPPRLRRDEDLQQPTPSHGKLLRMTRQVSLIKLGTSYLFRHVQLPASLLILTFTVKGAAVLLN